MAQRPSSLLGARAIDVEGSPPLRNDRPLIVLVGLAIAVSLAVGTQVTAWRLGFHARLGVPLAVPGLAASRLLQAGAVLAAGTAASSLAVSPWRSAALPLGLAAWIALVASLGPILTPYGLVQWQVAYGKADGARASLLMGWFAAGLTAVGLCRLTTRWWGRGSSRLPSGAHGTAFWGRGDALNAPKGLLLGRLGSRLLRLDGEGHVLTVAPTRTGKGVSAVIPNLLVYPGSVLVTDPKGENFAVTARRRRDLGQSVHAFDPFGVVYHGADASGAARFNPLDLVDTSSHDAIDDARLLADLLVIPEGHGRDEAFWNEEARGILTGLILHVAAHAPRELRSLARVRELLTLAPEPFAALLEEMSASEAVGGLVARAAARVLQKADRERSGVVSTAQSHTHFLDSPRMAVALRDSTLDLAVLKQRPTSIYLILPPARLEGYARYQRLMTGCALLAMTRIRGQPSERVLFLLDEFGHLGRMTPVQRDVGLVGGYGVRFWLVVQDLAQLRSTYPDTWATFLANVDVLQAFGTNDWETADHLSRLTGDATVRVLSDNRSTGVSRGRHSQEQRGTASTTSEIGRKLLFPDEVRRLPSDRALLFVKGTAPLLVERLDYLRDSVFAGLSDPNPLYTPVSRSGWE